LARFVTFPGAAGAYVSTDDVNLLDADTAHAVQGVGAWMNRSNAVNFTSVLDTDSKFGGSALQFEAFNVGPGQIQIDIPITDTVVSPSTVYSVSCWVKVNDSVGTIDLTLVDYDSGSAQGGVTVGTAVAGVVGSYVFVEVTHTTAADAAFIIPIVTVRDQLANDSVRMSAVVIRAGSDSAFVPSLDIVGVLDEVLDPPGFPVAYVKTQDLRIGVSYTGDIVDYQRLDGVGGPIVAQFSADDIGI